jgi:hypothetical protein
MVESIVLAWSEQLGNHVLATKDIHPGEVLIRCHPYGVIVEENYYLSVCIQCWKQSSRGTKFKFQCHVCKQVSFCSEVCSNQFSVHFPNGLECRALKHLGQKKKNRSCEFLTNLRMMFHVVSKAAREMDEDSPFLENYDIHHRNAELSSGSLNPLFRHIYHLEGNQYVFESSQPNEFNQVQKQAKQAKKLILLAQKDLKSSFSYPAWWPEIIQESVFIRLLCNMMCNCYGIWNSKARCIGSLFGASMSYFNHSCSPNCSRFKAKPSEPPSSVVTIRALRSILAGEQLTICYSGLKMPFTQRHEKIRKGYLFECACERCTHESASEPYEKVKSIMCKQRNCAGAMVTHKISAMSTHAQKVSFPSLEEFSYEAEEEYPQFENDTLVTRQCSLCGFIEPDYCTYCKIKKN